jgi:hypothetical protein
MVVRLWWVGWRVGWGVGKTVGESVESGVFMVGQALVAMSKCVAQIVSSPDEVNMKCRFF